MRDGFRSFAELLAPVPVAPVAPDAESMQPEPAAAPRESCACVQTLRDVRLFRARVAEAVDASVHMLLQDVAAEVLARELEIATADVAAIVRRAIARFDADEPLRVRVAPSERDVAAAVPVHVDHELREGDAIVEFTSGSVDARLGTRFACVLEALT